MGEAGRCPPRMTVASAEGESGGQERRARAEAHADGAGWWAIKGECGGRERRASAEGERGEPMLRPHRTRLISLSRFSIPTSPFIQDGSDYNSEYQYQIFHGLITFFIVEYCSRIYELHCSAIALASSGNVLLRYFPREQLTYDFAFG